MVGGIGGFAGLFDASALQGLRPPAAGAPPPTASGTKVAIAQALDKHDTIGFDLVGMLVDDLVVCGAEPLFLTDYIASGRVVPERIAAIVQGIAEACVLAGCALIGGETAEHPGLLGPDEYDVAGSTTGVVEADAVLGPGAGPRPATWSSRWPRAACTPTATPWCATCCSETAGAGWALDRHVDELGRTLGEELLEPTRIYAKACLDAGPRDRDPRDVARHRRRPGGQPGPGAARRPQAVSSTARTWTPPPVFGLVAEVGGVAAGRPRADAQLRRRHGGARRARTTPRPRSRCSRRHGIEAWVGGEVDGRERRGDGGTVTLRGEHAGWEAGRAPGRTGRRRAPSAKFCAIDEPGVREHRPGRYRGIHETVIRSDRTRVRRWPSRSSSTAEDGLGVTRPSVRGGRPNGARPCEGEADQGCPRPEVPLPRDGLRRAGRELHGDDDSDSDRSAGDAVDLDDYDEWSDYSDTVPRDD